MAGEVEILDSEMQAFDLPQATAIQQRRNQPAWSDEMLTNRPDFILGQDYWQPSAPWERCAVGPTRRRSRLSNTPGPRTPVESCSRNDDNGHLAKPRR